ncbi:SulP family inorganic anion transporter [Bradyrhizobium sp. CCH5-F6]|uniref:SulP family inorganic anion transporter n=1 Tax=Bradyrhizobium sp. CCH5-F6 TaxID=1768753 RepID=UPI0032E46AA8
MPIRGGWAAADRHSFRLDADLIGATGLGSLIHHLPHPVRFGFTCGIAGTIFSSQIRDLFGLTLAGSEPGPVVGTALPGPELGCLRHRGSAPPT